MTLWNRLADERFLHHRLRATSWSAMAGAAVAGALFLWHLHDDGTPRWELFAVIATMAVVKLACMAYHLVRA